MAAMSDFLLPLCKLFSLDLAGLLGKDMPSSEEMMPSNLSTLIDCGMLLISLPMGFEEMPSIEVEEGNLLTNFTWFLVTGMPNLAGSVNGVAGSDTGGSVMALKGVLGKEGKDWLLSDGIGGIEEDGTATLVLLVRGLLAL